MQGGAGGVGRDLWAEPVRAPLPRPCLVRARAGPAPACELTGHRGALHAQAEPPPARQPAPARLASSPGPWPDSGGSGGGRSRGQAEALAASLRARPRDGPGIPRLLPIYGRGEAAALCRAGGIVLRGCLASANDSWILVKPWQGNCLTAATACWRQRGARPRGLRACDSSAACRPAGALAARPLLAQHRAASPGRQQQAHSGHTRMTRRDGPFWAPGSRSKSRVHSGPTPRGGPEVTEEWVWRVQRGRRQPRRQPLRPALCSRSERTHPSLSLHPRLATPRRPMLSHLADGCGD